ncbi:AraC family transcriptional regulator [Paenibacillus barcinonensis]|jgi:AraC-like DNA-binding protein|uniref:AraC family transcriptional regulator n=1 Tax=Paenibacillus barcinonensis TaxID=198119 RepID=UPI00209D489F|nr:AraC family transcriptional regulator [Paenibacillus barcinonensis]
MKPSIESVVCGMNTRIFFGKTDEAARLPIYMTTVGYWEHQYETERPEGFPDYQIHQIIQGQGRLIIQDEEEYIVGPGEVFITYPDIPHRYEPITDRWELAWVSFQGREASQLLAYAGITGSGVYKLRNAELLHALQQMLMRGEGVEVTLDADGDRDSSKHLYALLLDLKPLLIAGGSDNDEMERLKPVLRYITEHLDQPLSLKELADVAVVSPQYLCRLFQKALHVRPVFYVNQERINRSKQLMFSERTLRIYEVADRVGYENASYFCTMFKRHTGMSPERFRKLHGLT